MKHRLSHNQSEIFQWTGLLVWGILPWTVALLLVGFVPFLWSAIGALVVNLVTLLLSLRLFKAEFDREFLYLTRRSLFRQIDLRDVTEIKALPFPVHLIFSTAYLVRLTYSVQDRQRKVYILSRGQAGWNPTLDSLAEISLFREYVSRKRVGMRH